MQKIKVTDVFDWLTKTTERINLLVGGAGSSKSYSVAQNLLRKFFEEKDIRILVVRKTTPSLRITAYHLILDLLKEYGWLSYCSLNKTEMTLTYGSNEMLFKGLDDPEKIKSAEFNYIWVEEATEITLEDYRQLNLRLRRKGKLNQIFLTCNPISALHWIKTELADKQKIAINHSTYKDNPFLDEVYKQQLEDLINQDVNFYKIYTLGEWGVLKNIIYEGWKSYGNISEYGKQPQEISYGIDWGYESPAALVKVYWFDGDKVIWEEIIYQKKLTTPEFIELAKERLVEDIEEDKKEEVLRQEIHREFYAGTDEPASIQQFYDAGFNIQKARTDVRDGINFCKSHLIGIIGTNLIKEVQGYKRKEDKNGNVLEEPVKFMDHGMDAGRYGTYSRVGSLGYSEVLDISFR